MLRAAPVGISAALLLALAGHAHAATEGIPTDVSITSINGPNGIRIGGIDDDDRCGAAVASGDINGDGISDLVIGSKYADPGGDGAAGEAYVIFGRKPTTEDPFLSSFDLTTLNGENGFRIDGISAGDFSGATLAIAPDINGDKVNDIVIGAPYANGTGGTAFVVYGSKTTPFTASISLGLLEGPNGFRAENYVAGEYAGTAVAAGDINGDKLSDVIIGAPFADAGAGAVYVVFGRKATNQNDLPLLVDLSKLDGTFGFKISGLSAGDGCGSAVAAADINADKIADLIIGAPLADPNADSAAGEVYVVFGHKKNDPFPATFDLADIDGTNGTRFVGLDPGDNCGASLAAAGDFNADKITDLLIGAPNADQPGAGNCGEAYLVFGRKATNTSPYPASASLDTLDGANGLRITGSIVDDGYGSSVASAGDINADKFADIIIGAATLANEIGQAGVLFGRKPTTDNPFPATIAVSDLDGTDGFRINGVNAGDQAGFAVASAGDFNADKVGDIIIGAPFVSDAAGEATLILGPSPKVQVSFENIDDTSLSVPLIADGGTIDLGQLFDSTSYRVVIGIQNLGLAQLELAKLKLPRGSEVFEPLDASLDALDDTQFQFDFTTAPRAGNYSAKVSFSTNDPAAKKFDFTMLWTVIEVELAAASTTPAINLDTLPDLNSDWITDAADLTLMLRAIEVNDSAGDLNADDHVTTDDLVILLSAFNTRH